MTNGELIDILSKSPRDKEVVLNCVVSVEDNFRVNRLNYHINEVCEYDDRIEIEQ